MLDFKLICVNILSRETCFLCLRVPSPLYCASRVGSSRCSAAMYFKAALCSHNIVIRISELRACACVVLCFLARLFVRFQNGAEGSDFLPRDRSEILLSVASCWAASVSLPVLDNPMRQTSVWCSIRVCFVP